MKQVILTPLPAHRLRAMLAGFAGHGDDPQLARLLRRIAASRRPVRARGASARAHQRAAVNLARRVGMGVRCSAGRSAFGWDGHALYGRTEAYVLLHEIAHFQVAAPQRRRTPDFGLGPGPDTLDRAGAEARSHIRGAARDREEAMASLLGILWELSLGQPSLASLLDQNWLEGSPRDAARHVGSVFRRLVAGGYVGANGAPSYRVRRQPDQ